MKIPKLNKALYEARTCDTAPLTPPVLPSGVVPAGTTPLVADVNQATYVYGTATTQPFPGFAHRPLGLPLFSHSLEFGMEFLI